MLAFIITLEVSTIITSDASKAYHSENQINIQLPQLLPQGPPTPPDAWRAIYPEITTYCATYGPNPGTTNHPGIGP